jgi:hypothetical protein
VGGECCAVWNRSGRRIGWMGVIMHRVEIEKIR